ncbi:hypothetical protein GCM10022284_37370 [Streptomyces hundungensis]
MPAEAFFERFKGGPCLTCCGVSDDEDRLSSPGNAAYPSAQICVNLTPHIGGQVTFNAGSSMVDTKLGRCHFSDSDSRKRQRYLRGISRFCQIGKKKGIRIDLDARLLLIYPALLLSAT